MRQQSAFGRCHRNWLGLSPSSSPCDLYLQTKPSDFSASAALSAGGNIYLQSLQEADPPASSSKKQRKIKVFGIPENRIRRDEHIPELFDSPPRQRDSGERDQMLIDSHLHIATSLIEQPPLEAGSNADIYDENQLQQLLYCSGSSASLPPGEPSGHQNRAESVRTEEIDQMLQVEVPLRETDRESSSILPSRLNFPLKNTDSSYLAEEKAKEGQGSQASGKNSFFLKAVLEGKPQDLAGSTHKEGQEMAKSRHENSKILQMHEHVIFGQQFSLELNAISPIPKKYDQIMLNSIEYNQPREETMPQQPPKHQSKLAKRPAVPLPKKAERVEQVSEHLNIKNYLQSYGSYQQEIHKMINKLQKVAELKDKEQFIKRELQTLTHKKHQSAGSMEPQPLSKPKSHKAYQTSSPDEKLTSPHVFAQSASHFLPSRRPEDLPRNSIDRELHQDVVKMERIINKFKEISQIISTDGTHLEEKGFNYRRQRSEKNLRGANSYEHLMFQSEKLGVESMDLPNYVGKKTISQPQIQIKIPEKMQAALNDSQELESQNFTNKEKVELTSRNADRSIQPYCANTIRTEKKPLHGMADRCESRYKKELHSEKQCECSHTKLAQEIAKLSQKMQDLEKEKVKEARSLDKKQLPRHKDLADEEGSVHEESSCFEFIPKQIEESVQSIKAKIGKQNPHICSNLQPVSILKPSSALKQHTSSLKTEEVKPSPTLTKRKVSKEMPPKPKNASRSPQVKKAEAQQGQFREEIDVTSLQIGFPIIACYLSNSSSESAIIKFGEATYAKLLAFACGREGRGGRLEEKAGFKIKKYEDCIHYYLQNSLKYHLVCYFRGKLYFGQLKDTSSDCKHGFGYYSTPKYVYEGEFAMDKKHGRGTVNYANGDLYRGGWRNGKREGEGVMVNLAGDIFKGTFQNGKKNGKGEERLKNGDFYRGEFKEGKLDGEGAYWWIDGSTYRGGFKGGLLHGHGVWRSKANDCYEGEYRENKKYGKGIYKWGNGMIFTGVFEAGQQVSGKKPSSPDPLRKNGKSGQRAIRTRQNSAQKL